VIVVGQEGVHDPRDFEPKLIAGRQPQRVRLKVKEGVHIRRSTAPASQNGAARLYSPGLRAAENDISDVYNIRQVR
jgi:hypothetical protein